MSQNNFILKDYIDSFFDYAMSRAVELGIVKASKEYQIPELKENIETFWEPIGSFIHEQFQKKYPDQKKLEPVATGQITAYAGMVAAYLWYNENESITSNILDENNSSKISEDEKAIYKCLDFNFVSSYSVDISNMTRSAEEIDDVQKFFLKYLGFTYETEDEISLRGAFNNIFCDIYIKVNEKAKEHNIFKPVTIINRTMILMFKIGFAIGMQKYLRKYHIIGWINGGKKNPPKFLVVANPVPYSTISKSVDDVNFEVNSKITVCFILPYSLEWFDIVDYYQCDKEQSMVKEWIPNMEEYEFSPQFISGERYKGYIHKGLIKQGNK